MGAGEMRFTMWVVVALGAILCSDIVAQETGSRFTVPVEIPVEIAPIRVNLNPSIQGAAPVQQAQQQAPPQVIYVQPQQPQQPTVPFALWFHATYERRGVFFPRWVRRRDAAYRQQLIMQGYYR